MIAPHASTICCRCFRAVRCLLARCNPDHNTTMVGIRRCREPRCVTISIHFAPHDIVASLYCFAASRTILTRWAPYVDGALGPTIPRRFSCTRSLFPHIKKQRGALRSVSSRTYTARSYAAAQRMAWW